VRILVVGSVPPPAGAHRSSLLAHVLRLRGDDQEVEILSLDPLAAAHRYLAGRGLVAVGEIGLLARRYEALVVQLEPGLPVRLSAGRSERTAALFALAAILRRCPDVTLRLDEQEDLPGGLGGRAALAMWQAAGRIEVGDETTRASLAGLLGSLGARVHVAAAGAGSLEPLAAPDPEGWGDGADATASHVLGIVRARAAAERASLARRTQLPAGHEPEARVPQWQWLPEPGAGVPDLGPLIKSPSDGRGRSRFTRPTPWPALSPRGAATSLLAAAERRPSTRPAAHLARLAIVELRSALRRAS
jgi:hypothetical protein